MKILPKWERRWVGFGFCWIVLNCSFTAIFSVVARPFLKEAFWTVIAMVFFSSHIVSLVPMLLFWILMLRLNKEHISLRGSWVSSGLFGGAIYGIAVSIPIMLPLAAVVTGPIFALLGWWLGHAYWHLAEREL